MRRTGQLSGLLLALVLASSVAMAEGRIHIEADVPFSFIAGSMTFPAGHYMLIQASDTTPDLWTIQSRDHKVTGELISYFQEGREPAEETELVFDIYGTRHFLSKIWLQGDQWGWYLSKSRAERALLGAHHKSKESVEKRHLRAQKTT